MPKVIFYRHKCIGCSICREMQPAIWHMSKKDGKAVLLNSIEKKQIHQLSIHDNLVDTTKEVVEACPARVIKIA
jgi:ferredoxin